jgi:hypothetical protein
MFKKLLQSGLIEVEGRSLVAHYFELKTARGARRFSCEVVLGAADRVILDDDSVTSLQARVARLAPATIYSRALAARITAAPSVAA